MELHRRAEVMQRRADVQNLSAMLLELCKRRTTDVERSLQVDIDDRAKAVRRQLFSLTKKVSRRAINNDIDFAKLFDRLCHSAFDLSRLTHIRNCGDRFAARCIDRISRRLKVLEISAHQRNTRTRCRKRSRDSASDSRPAASHKRDVSVQNSLCKDCLAHCEFAICNASSSLNFPSYKALPTITLSSSGSLESRNRLISSRLETPPEAVTRTFAARTTASVCSTFGPVSMPSRAMSV